MGTSKTRSFTCEGIRITPLLNKGGSCAYRVDVGQRVTGGKRIFRQFKTRDEAEAFASLMARERANNGVASFAISLDQRSLAERAFSLLQASNLPETALLDCVQFYLRHHKPEGGDITVSALVERYIKGKRSGETAKGGKPLRDRSLQDIESRLSIFCKSFGTKLVKDLAPKDLRLWLDDPTWTRQTSRNYHTILGGLFGYALSHKHVGSSPLAAVAKPTRAGDEEQTIGILLVEEALALLEAVRSHPELELGWFVALGLFCGARTAELERLAVADVKLDQGFLHIGPTVAKKRRLRNVDFSVATFDDITIAGENSKPYTERRTLILDPAGAWLRACPAPSTGRVTPAAFRYRWMRLLEICGWTRRDPDTKQWIFEKPWPSNALRHTYASMLFELTSNAPLVSTRLGHADGDLLFEHYRALVKKGEGRRFFSLTPPVSGNILTIPRQESLGSEESVPREQVPNLTAAS